MKVRKAVMHALIHSAEQDPSCFPQPHTLIVWRPPDFACAISEVSWEEHLLGQGAGMHALGCRVYEVYWVQGLGFGN